MKIHPVANFPEREIATQEVQHPPEAEMDVDTSTTVTSFASSAVTSSPSPSSSASPSSSPSPLLPHSPSHSSPHRFPHPSSPLTPPSPHPHCCSSQAISTPLSRHLMPSMLSTKIQALLTLFAVGIAIYIGFANGTSTQICLEFVQGGIQELKGEIQDMNLRTCNLNLRMEDMNSSINVKLANTQAWKQHMVLLVARINLRLELLEKSLKNIKELVLSLRQSRDESDDGVRVRPPRTERTPFHLPLPTFG
ncbi:hypothetical protein L211DRAFT_838890 [Terfezia boudieri ATCC MYA-4762]|uniref:Uncharacterized protein n=1 Tax=Terfezia boudieri ATCC MYA-4762 TaxID=1051890 RepID=A0A3N4LKH1_9PEZI|nr:hypothetical protein L211DRAFT_838890 [Terfezia boudieri ATCC MYA-4762]